MAFVQVIQYTASNAEDVGRVAEEWVQATQGKRSARRIVRTRERDNGDRYLDLVFFDSYDSAMENSRLPETQEYARKMGELIDGDPTYYDLEVVEDRDL